MIIDLNNSNEILIKLIKKNYPFSVVRLGDKISKITYDYILTNKINTSHLHPKYKTLYNAGIYGDIKNLELYCNFYNISIKNCDFLASFPTLQCVKKTQDYFSKIYNLQQIHNRSLEPFYVLQDNEIPWTHHLKGKKVLIINPFVKSFEIQLKNGFQIFKDKKIFLDDQEFVFYKSYQTIAGNHIHKNWFETFTKMCKDIKNLEFDIALLGCGGYGLPLCHFIKHKLNKSAIYVGGGLQLLFGVIGKRWENNPMWKKIINENNCKFIKPSKDELCLNFKTIEGGCYW